MHSNTTNVWLGDALTAHNFRAECFFSAFNGVYMGLAIFAAPIVAVTGVQANFLELTILVSAFPVGAFLGPLWAALGRRLGMKQLVVQTAIGANLVLFPLFWVQDSGVFTALLTFSQLLNSAMRMGQSSLYRVMYAKSQRGRILGRLTFWNFLTMVPTVLLTGWLLDKSPEMYRVVYPLGGMCGLMGCYYYRMLRIVTADLVEPRPTDFRSSIFAVKKVISQDRLFLLFQLSFFLAGSAFFMSTHVVLILIRDRFAYGALELAIWLSVVPQLLLAVGSLFWGHIIDRIGLVRSRILISSIMTCYLACYFGGIISGLPAFIYLGSVLQGLSNGGGALVWSMASSHFAPSPEDVPLYTGIHLVLNGIRGLVMPWVGSVAFVLIGPWAVLGATFVAMGSIPIALRALSLGDGPSQETERAGRETVKLGA